MLLEFSVSVVCPGLQLAQVEGRLRRLGHRRCTTRASSLPARWPADRSLGDFGHSHCRADRVTPLLHSFVWALIKINS